MSDNPQEPRAWTTKNLDGSTSENIFWTALDDAVELEPTGQLSIGVDGEQRAIPGLAPAGKPAPLTFERDAAEKEAREELEERARAAAYEERARNLYWAGKKWNPPHA